MGFSESLSISAAHGRGISELIETIDQLLPSPSAIDQSPVTSRQSLSIAIIGRPNVGKSSLINSIVRSERAIVSELPGTTRDAIDISYERNGQQFLFIDTAGIRRRGKQSSSVEVFSVMRAERSIRRADFCVLIVDLTTGVTAQDKRIGGLIQKAHKAAIVILNKWDLIKPKRSEKKMMAQLIDETRARIFFLGYAPVLIASARTGENIDNLFALIARVRRAALSISTGFKPIAGRLLLWRGLRSRETLLRCATGVIKTAVEPPRRPFSEQPLIERGRRASKPHPQSATPPRHCSCCAHVRKAAELILGQALVGQQFDRTLLFRVCLTSHE
jgi:small GTP-binding protein